MRYAQVRSMDISNGESIGVSLFVQGCPFNPHCKNCFNPDTWDFNGGKEWTQETEDKFIELANRPYIKRLSILGGEPLAEENLDGVLHLVDRFRLSFPNKSIWIYSGYTWESIVYSRMPHPPKHSPEEFLYWNQRMEIISKCDILIDGRYIDSQRNPSKKWAGSDNQRVIDIQESLQQNKVILYCD